MAATHIATHLLPDTGCTGHYVPPYVHLNALRPNRIGVRMPDARKVYSTHAGRLPALRNLPSLASQIAHRIPSLKTSLLSISTLCDDDCVAVFTKAGCYIFHDNKLVLRGTRDRNTTLWKIPVDTSEGEKEDVPSSEGAHSMCNLEQLTSKRDIIRFLHASLFSPVKSTWLQAIKNKQFHAWPGINAGDVRKHLQPTIATAKGHLNRKRKNTRSTQISETVRKQDIAASPEHQKQLDMTPLPEPKTNDVFISFLATDTTGTVYSDLTGKFPVTSLAGNKYVLVLYDYDSNAILFRPMRNRSDEQALAAYASIYDYLSARNCKPRLNIMDNEASQAVRRYILSTGATYQLVEPYNHRVNAAERAIRTFKDHFVAGLATVHPSFPLYLWDELLDQAFISLNLLRASRTCPRMSAYSHLEGPFDYNSTPMAPPGCRALVFEDPEIRTSYAPHGVEGFYLGPALDHYRCYRFYIPSTGHTWITGTAQFFPHALSMPTLTTTDQLLEAARTLVECIKNPSPVTLARTPQRHFNALRQLSSIFQTSVRSRTGSKISQPLNKTVEAPENLAPQSVQKQPPRLADYVRPPTHRYPTRARQPTCGAAHVHKDPAPPSVLCADATARYRSLATKCLTTREIMRKIPHLVCNVYNDETKRLESYQQLLKTPSMRPIWTKAMCKELGRLSQGYKDEVTGTNTISFMTRSEVRLIPPDKTVTYPRIVVDLRLQKPDPNRVRMTVGGNLLNVPGDLGTPVADMATIKILWNSVLSTRNAKFACIDIKDMYLQTPLLRPEYMRIPVKLIPDEFVEEYKLHDKFCNGFVYCRIDRGMYGLPQAGKLAYLQLKKRLATCGYIECKHSPGLWRHIFRPVQFVLVVDDFGVKFVGEEHLQHLLTSLRKWYEIHLDTDGRKYVGLDLNWDYTRRTVDVAMRGYVDSKLREYDHKPPTKPQHSPYPCAPRFPSSQKPIPQDAAPTLDAKRTRQIQRIVGSFLHYARAVDITLLKALNTLGSQQAKPTETTEKNIRHFLDYCATHSDAKIRFFASEMILQIHSDASYMNESKARSTASGHFFLGNKIHNNKPIFLNGAIHTLCKIIGVAASAAEAELGALFLNTQEAMKHRLTLEALGHKQPPTPVHTDNTTAASIIHRTIRQQRSRAMNMRYFWSIDKQQDGNIDVSWHPGGENLGDYASKHHPPSVHRAVRPLYVHTSSSPRFLKRHPAPHQLRGCANTHTRKPT